MTDVHDVFESYEVDSKTVRSEEEVVAVFIVVNLEAAALCTRN